MMGGLANICKRHGSMKVTDRSGKTITWLWDYASDKAVVSSDMPVGSERWKASERAKWKPLSENVR